MPVVDNFLESKPLLNNVVDSVVAPMLNTGAGPVVIP